MGDDNMADSIYYDFNTTLSKNALINFILSNRGAGKTYGYKDYAIRDFLKTGWQFVYLRRYQSELANIDQYFDDIKNKYPEHTFSTSGGKKGGKFLIDNKIAGFFAPVSSSLAFKSVPYPNVNKICYDEFIIPKGPLHYLPDEAHMFFEFVETINRLRETEKLHELVRVFCFANTISLINPYFDEFDLYVDTTKRYNIYPEYNKDVLVEIYKNEEFVKRKEDTRIGKIMMKTKYGKYAIKGEFYEDDSTFIEERPKESVPIICLKYKDKDVYFYFDFKNGKVYASFDKYNDIPWRFTLTSNDHQPNYFLIKNASNCGQTRVLLQAFSNGLMRFQNLQVKSITFKILQCLGVREK